MPKGDLGGKEQGAGGKKMPFLVKKGGFSALFRAKMHSTAVPFIVNEDAVLCQRPSRTMRTPPPLSASALPVVPYISVPY